MELPGYDNWKLSNASDYTRPTDEILVHASFRLVDVDGEVYEETLVSEMTRAQFGSMTPDEVIEHFTPEIEEVWTLEPGQVITLIDKE